VEKKKKRETGEREKTTVEDPHRHTDRITRKVKN
jgi:hypothetical protein